MALEMTGKETDAPRCPGCGQPMTARAARTGQLWRAMWYCPHGAYRCGIWQTQPQRARQEKDKRGKIK